MKAETTEILIEAKDYMERLRVGLGAVAASLREGNGYQMTDFADMYEGMQWLSTALAGTADDHGIDFEWAKTENILRELLDAIDGDDRVLIADLLEYEILPVLETCGQKITATIV